MKNGTIEPFNYDSLPVWNIPMIPMATGAWVYHLLRDGRVVYVGMTTDGIMRIMQHAAEGVKKFDSFRARPCKHGQEARRIESRDIWDFNPEYNINGPYHPHYSTANFFYMARRKLASHMTMKEFMASLPFVVRCGKKFWHIRHRYPAGHPKNQLSYWQSLSPDLYQNV